MYAFIRKPKPIAMFLISALDCIFHLVSIVGKGLPENGNMQKAALIWSVNLIIPPPDWGNVFI